MLEIMIIIKKIFSIDTIYVMIYFFYIFDMKHHTVREVDLPSVADDTYCT